MFYSFTPTQSTLVYTEISTPLHVGFTLKSRQHGVLQSRNAVSSFRVTLHLFTFLAIDPSVYQCFFTKKMRLLWFRLQKKSVVLFVIYPLHMMGMQPISENKTKEMFSSGNWDLFSCKKSYCSSCPPDWLHSHGRARSLLRGLESSLKFSFLRFEPQSNPGEEKGETDLGRRIR